MAAVLSRKGRADEQTVLLVATAGAAVALANGWTGYADALTAGPYLGSNGFPLLLTQATTLPAADSTFLTAQAGSLDSVLALGLQNRISDADLGQAFTAIG